MRRKPFAMLALLLALLSTFATAGAAPAGQRQPEHAPDSRPQLPNDPQPDQKPAALRPGAQLDEVVPLQAFPCPVADIVFAVDTTGSMLFALDYFKGAFPAIADQIALTTAGNYQMGLVTFKDDVTVVHNLRFGNASDVKASVSGLEANGGNGIPEASDEAVRAAVNMTNWRPGEFKLIVLITDAPPGGFKDEFIPGVGDKAAEERAREALAKEIRIASIYATDFPRRNDIIVMENYATIAGGLYQQVSPSSIGAAVSNALNTTGQRCQRHDIYSKDSAVDFGIESSIPPVWSSPDIEFCFFPDDLCSTTYTWRSRFIRVRLRNRGPYVQPAQQALGDLHVHGGQWSSLPNWSFPYGSPNWPLIGAATNLSFRPGQARRAFVPWQSRSFLLRCANVVARWVAPGDPMRLSSPDIGSLTLYNNNMAWKNTCRIVLPPTTTATTVPRAVPFGVKGLGGVAVVSELRLWHDDPRVPLPDVVTVDLGARLFALWQAAGQPGQGVVAAEGTTVRITDLRDARISGLRLEPDEQAEVIVRFDGSKSAGSGSPRIQVGQFVPKSAVTPPGAAPAAARPLADEEQIPINGLQIDIQVGTIRLKPGGAETRSFTLRNPQDTEAISELQLIDLDGSYAGQGALLVDLGADLFGRWVANGQQGRGIERAEGTSILVTDLSDASIGGLNLAPQEQLDVTLRFAGKSTLHPAEHEVGVVQMLQDTSAPAEAELFEANSRSYTVEVPGAFLPILYR